MQKNIELQENLKSQLVVKPSWFYKKISVPPVSPLTTIWTGTGQCVFYIPWGVLNFWLIELQMSIWIAAALNNNQNSLHCDYFPFLYRVELIWTQNNISLVDIIEVDKYWKIIGPLYNNFSQRSSWDGFMFKSSRTAINNNNNTTGDAPNAGLATVALNAIINNQGGQAAGAQMTNDFPAVYIYGANNAVLTANFNINLKDLLPDSLFSLNKDIPSENLILRLTFRDRSYIYCHMLTAGYTMVAQQAGAAGDITLTNLNLNVYSQSNPDLINVINWKNQNGEEIIIPNVQCYSQSYGANVVNHSSSIRPVCAFNNAHLYKTYWSVFLWDVANAGAALLQCNNSNHNNALWLNASYWLNNEILKQLNCALYDDYRDIKRQFKDGDILDVSLTRAWGALLQTFDSDKIKEWEEYNKNELKGIPYNYLNRDITIQTNFTLQNLANAATDYTYIVSLVSLYCKNGKFWTIPF